MKLDLTREAKLNEVKQLLEVRIIVEVISQDMNGSGRDKDALNLTARKINWDTKPDSVRSYLMICVSDALCSRCGES